MTSITLNLMELPSACTTAIVRVTSQFFLVIFTTMLSSALWVLYSTVVYCAAFFCTVLYCTVQDVWNRTYYPNGEDQENVNKKWYIVDASNKRLGRLASSIAMHIRGKTEPTYTPSVDMGAYVIVVSSPLLCRLLLIPV